MMFDVKYLKQGLDGYETFFRVDKDNWVRVDFLLEYFLSGDVKLTKNYKGDFKSFLGNVKYASELLETFGSLILDKTKFNYEHYTEWLKNKMEVDKAIELIRATTNA